MGAGMKISRPPELSDGGYWYVVDLVLFENSNTPGEIVTEGYNAWYTSTQVILRTTSPLVSVASLDIIPSSLLTLIGYTNKPFARFRGR